MKLREKVTSRQRVATKREMARISATLEMILTLKVGPARMQKDSRKKKQQSSLWQSCVHGFYPVVYFHRSRVLLFLVHMRAQTRIVIFYHAKKFPRNTGKRIDDYFLFTKSILTVTSEHSSDNRIKPGALAVYISDYIQAQMRIVSFDLDLINTAMIYRATYYNAARKISLCAVSISIN